MKTILEFDSSHSYEDWQDQEGNLICCLEDMDGNYLGDIQEQYLVEMWNNQEIISIENPKGIYEETLASLANSKCQNYVVLPEYVQKAKKLVVEIKILNK
jgi:hypothetical protein